MSKLEIRTNNIPRDLIGWYDLTDKEREEFDYINEEEREEAYDRFFRYRGNAYDTHEFVRIVPLSRASGFAHAVAEDSPLLKWDGIQTDSFFSGIVIRFVDDWERVIVGLALS